jgi:glutathione S-transferase
MAHPETRRIDAHVGVLEGINPNGRVPVLENESGRFLHESNAILFYLADGSLYLPDEG